MRIIVNSLQNVKMTFDRGLHFSETKQIKQISKRKDFFELLARSFAPSISGNEAVKKGLLLMMVGGEEKNFENGTHLRGDLNLLLVGDPSCGKEVFLGGVGCYVGCFCCFLTFGRDVRSSSEFCRKKNNSIIVHPINTKIEN